MAVGNNETNTLILVRNSDLLGTNWETGINGEIRILVTFIVYITALLFFFLLFSSLYIFFP